ncbi:MAG: hypothetical protein EAZ73_07955 [Oscillatoriales cyanobacterium]|nr:MAG: hypothetical protein EAZ83_07330 [Oscillatoriales cyanobacterium]TAF21662.1 MAG: hypothetical protein EAZ73_07955 [Oscillatoriales cyanobacterium]TAF27467.1 MAG: hypothetical protein EAZ69_28060 [Oscillatoriales cyanobacterium]
MLVVSCSLFTVHCQLFTVHCQLLSYQLLSESTAFGVNCQLSTVNCPLAVRVVFFTVNEAIFYIDSIYNAYY